MVVFCTTCKGRAQHIEQTLPKNLADNADYVDLKFVILNYNSPDHLNHYLQANHAAEVASGRVVAYHHTKPGPFQMAHAKNMAHRLGIMEGGDILVNLDADNYTGLGFAQYVADEFETAASVNEKMFLWARMIKGDYARGISGRIAVTQTAFMLVGGYDEKFATWSPDDKDFTARLKRLGYEGQEIRREFLDAVRHSDKMRFKEYQQVEHEFESGKEHYALDMINAANHTIANYGKVGDGYVFRNFGSMPIAIPPMATRIFGIGAHKTATTSLYTALKILGFDSAHWKSAHWAKAIWQQMNNQGRSLTLEKSYSLSDLPIPMLYRKLDAAYPGSKFILTIRDEDEWLNSVRNHWNPGINPYRHVWDTDPFTNILHQKLYGTTEFDEAVFREKYRWHNGDVMEYFRDRPDDLLVMNMSNGAGWAELCHFLRVPLPSIPYPQAFATKLV